MALACLKPATIRIARARHALELWDGAACAEGEGMASVRAHVVVFVAHDIASVVSVVYFKQRSLENCCGSWHKIH